MSNWTSAPLGDLFDIARGGSPRPIDDFLTDADDGVNWISISDATNSDKYIRNTKRKIKPAGVSRSRVVRPGDFLLTNSMSFGRPYIMATSGCIHDGWLSLSPKSAITDPDYLFQVLSSQDTYKKFERLAAGATVKNLNIDLVRSVEIPLPPLDEQRRIAAILDQADALRRKRREALARLDGLTEAIFVDMFGDWSRPGSADPVVRIGTRLDFLTSGSRGWAEYYRDRGSIFLRIQNVRHDELDLSDVAFVHAPETAEAKRTRILPGDVLLSITADLGRTAVVPDGLGEAFINQHLSILRSSWFVPRFLSAALSSPAGQKTILGRNREGVKAGLNFDDIRSFAVPDVDRKIQQTFADRASGVDRMRDRQRAEMSRLDALFASLQHRAFQGNLGQ